MGLTAKEDVKRDPVPEGAHLAVCYGVVDLGTQPPLPGSKFGNKRTHKVLYMWELPDERIEVEREGVRREMPRGISKDFAVSLHEKANLRKFLVAWRGRQFTETELKGFELQNVLKIACVLNVVHNDRGYAEIASVMPTMKGQPKQREPENDVIVFDLDEHPMGEPLPTRLPQWVRERIERSDEWQARMGNAPDDSHAPPPSDGDHDDLGEIPFS